MEDETVEGEDTAVAVQNPMVPSKLGRASRIERVGESGRNWQTLKVLRQKNGETRRGGY